MSSRAGALEAESRGLRLQWSAPATCPTQRYVEQRLAATLRHPPPSEAWAKATIESVAGQYQLTLATYSGKTRGERQLRHVHCQELADAAIAIVAWTIDADFDARQSNPPAPTPPPPAEPARNVGSSFGSSILASTGSVGLPDLGAALDATVSPWPHLGAQAQLSAWLSRERTLHGEFEAGGRAQLSAASLAACSSSDPELQRWVMCLGAEVGLLRAAGTGELAPSRQSHALWLAASLQLLVPLVRTRTWSIPLRLALVAPIDRTRYSLERPGSASSEVVFETQPTLRLGIGLAF